MVHRARPEITPVPESPPSKAPESSVLFSLYELIELERVRVEEERVRERQAVEREQAAKMEAELRLRVAEEARRRAEAEKRSAEAQALREGEARVAAIHAATVERARVEALDRARLAELELVHKHEQALRRDAAARATARARTSLVVVVTSSLLIGFAALSYYFGVVQPRDEKDRAELARQATAAEAEARASQAAIAELAREGVLIREQIATARAEQSAALTAIPTATETPPKAVNRRLQPSIPSATPTGCSARDRIDPASSCLR